MPQINLGLIGCGTLGRIHAECASKIPDARLVAYADINEYAAKSALDAFGGDYATNDANRTLAPSQWMN